MGVPKFFRYMSERYPCLIELIREHQIPDFDNLYLDMNGIIHACSHPNDFNPQFSITEEVIFASIFHYVEVLFNMIKPKKLFFLAVDGVAPRAKMNQQRARRFKSAREAEMMRKKALEENKIVSKEWFDSNCITPGTAFMDRLHSQLKYFVTSKVSTDPSWQNCKVILSGHQTPGEGEHKIMDYIRYLKTLPDYDDNTRHCLYGLDADLIMLGLCTHEPHFALLREKVLFKKHYSKTIKSPDEMEFYLLHLSLFREYLDLEFQELKNLLPFSYNLENIIDDWILMGFLVGNDFIPNLPDLHINKNALPIMYAAYKDVLPSLDGYLNENGYLNLQRFQQFMKRLSQHDLDTFEESYANLNYFEEKIGKNSAYEKKPDGEIGRKSDLEALIKSMEKMLEIIHEEVPDEENTDVDDDFLWEFSQHKRNYYTTKLDYSNVTAEVLQSQAEGYIRAIQWNLHYYYQGCQSWSWYYPHHYSPYISDITNFEGLKLDFEMGKPFLPFEQLLAVLPAASKDLLPAAYQDLMTSPNSPIKDFYPVDFETDLNGKDHQWEAVVLIPFIDEKRLLEAMKSCEHKLTQEERERNRHGPMHVYTYTEKDLGIYKSRCYFPSIVSNHALVKDVSREEIAVELSKLKYGLRPGVSLDVFYLGFPTMKHIPHEAALKPMKVKVFDMQNRNSSMIITLKERKFPPIKELAKDILGKTVYVQWPHLIEARAVAVSDGATRFSVSEDEGIKCETVIGDCQFVWKKKSQEIKEKYLSNLGVVIGEVEVLVYVQIMAGRKYIFKSTGKVALEKIWSVNPKPYALQAIVNDITVDGGRIRPYLDFVEAFPLNCTVFMLGQPHFGSMGRVLDSSECWKNGRLKVAFETVNDPVISESILKRESSAAYLPCRVAAVKAGIHPRLLSRLAGAILVSMTNEEGPESKGSKVNIGLNLKFSRTSEEIPGYTKRENDIWLYSMKAVEVITQYVEKFSRVVEYLSNNWNNTIHVHDIFPGSEGIAELNEMISWIKNQEHTKLEKFTCGTETISSDEVAKIEEIVENSPKEMFTRIMQVKPSLLYRSDLVFGKIAPVTSAQHCLMDRIVSIKSSYTVPTGLRGFIIGIHPATEKADYMYDVLFDKSFLGASKGVASSEKIFKMSSFSFINVTDIQRKSQAKQPKKQNVVNAVNSSAPLILRPTGNWNNSKNSAFVQFFQPPAQPPVPEINEEFQKMWLSLQKPQEPTNALKKILKIQEGQKVPVEKAIEDPVRSFFEKVTKASQDNQSAPPFVVPLVRENSTDYSSRYFNQLFSYCQKKNLAQPRYKFYELGSRVMAQVRLSDGSVHSSVPCDNKETACENAAFQAWGAMQRTPHRGTRSHVENESENKLINWYPFPTDAVTAKSMESCKKRPQPNSGNQRPPPNYQKPPILPTPPSQWVGLSGYQGRERGTPKEQKFSNQTQNHSNQRKQSSAFQFVPLQAISGKRNFKSRTFHSTFQGPQKQLQGKQEKPQNEPITSLHNRVAPSAQPKRKPKIAANLGLDPNLP